MAVNAHGSPGEEGSVVLGTSAQWRLSGVPDKLEAPEIPLSPSPRNNHGPHYGVQSVVPVPAGGVQTATAAIGALPENTHGFASRARHGQPLGCVGLGSSGIVGARHGRDGPRVVQLVARVAIFVFRQARDDDGKLEDSSVRAEPKTMEGVGAALTAPEAIRPAIPPCLDPWAPSRRQQS